MQQKELVNDFYQEVNKEWLSKAKIKSDKPGTGAFEELDRKLEKRIKSIFVDWKNDQTLIPNDNTLKQMIEFYKMTSDWTKRDQIGISPLKPIIKQIIDTYNSFEDLEKDYVNLVLKGRYLPIEFAIYNDFKDSSKQILWLGSPSLILPDTTYYQDQEKMNKLFAVYKQMCEYFLLQLGFSKDQSTKIIDQAIKFDILLSKYSLSREEAAKYAELYNMFSIEETKQKFNFFDIKKIAETLTKKQVIDFSIENVKFLNNFNVIFTKENFENYKSRLILETIISYSPYLSNDLREKGGLFSRHLRGVSKASKPEKTAIMQTLNYFKMPFGLYYGKRFFGEEGKNQVINMVNKMIKVYQNRLKENEWLSEQTKEKAIKKLAKLDVYIGFPEIYKPYYDQFEVKSYEQGSNLVQNIDEFNVISAKYVFSQYLEPVNKKYWSMSPATVNAYYNPVFNHIVFPAAIFDEPFYSPKRSSSANYGAIGAVIAHEISHGFDNNGALFDENGNLNNWWTEEDKQNFDKKTEEMIQLFDKVETSVGLCNGKLVVSENIADAGGIRCAFEAAKTEDDFNPKDFFISWATQWRSLYKEEYQKMLLVTDVHAPTKLRANQQVKNMDEFHEVFNVKETDKMFLPKEKRVKIW
ncbi:M13-type metalloendopeptidase [Mycoplasmopsis hyopharyngis]|uniref:M13-type metalloendopeptidase n=1 Tax=Mycoplasmopsis hyopharyngis TaxID=29558 RepID=UPI003873CA3D